VQVCTQSASVRQSRGQISLSKILPRGKEGKNETLSQFEAQKVRRRRFKGQQPLNTYKIFPSRENKEAQEEE
jgi:hypothetical protein